MAKGRLEQPGQNDLRECTERVPLTTSVWLMLRQDIIPGELKLYFSNVPAEINLKTLVRLSGMRWPIEASFGHSKQYLGMGDHEVRSSRGRCHHFTQRILDHFGLGGESPFILPHDRAVQQICAVIG